MVLSKLLDLLDLTGQLLCEGFLQRLRGGILEESWIASDRQPTCVLADE